MKDLTGSISPAQGPAADPGSATLVALESQLQAQQERLRELAGRRDEVGLARVRLQMALTLLELGREAEAWGAAHEAFDALVAHELWDEAVQACDAMFGADQPGSLSALGQGIWLAVTFPVDPQISVAMLQHVVDETPDESDGAAVAAAAAAYVVELRAEGGDKENLRFFTDQMLAAVARRHSDVKSQQEFEKWIVRLELDDPAKFLTRLRNVVDVLVQDDWWFDRDSLQAKLPVN